MRQIDRQWHQGGGFVTSVTEHHALVACADGFHFGFGHLTRLGFERLVHAHGDVTRLFGNGNQHAAGVSVEAFFARIIADLIDNFADEFVIIEDCVGGDLTEQHHIASLDGRLTGDT